MVGSKQLTPVWLSPSEAESHCKAGASVWKFASTELGLHPDMVLCGIGTEVTFEVVAAASWLRRKVPEMRVRVVNVTDLMVLSAEGTHPHAIDDMGFEALFTNDRNVHINYHGYVTELKGLLFGRPSLERVSIEGYREEGTTTTPFDMMLVNHVSRYHVAMQAVKGAAKWNERVSMALTELVAELQQKIKECRRYIMEHKEGAYTQHPRNWAVSWLTRGLQIRRGLMIFRNSVIETAGNCPEPGLDMVVSDCFAI